MDKETAFDRLRLLEGRDLRILADQYGVAVWKEGKKDKGWAGKTIERYLGIPLNSSRSPNLGSWELKLASLKRKKDGAQVVKETMQITMIDDVEVLQNGFEESHLFRKLRKIIAVARMFESSDELESRCELVHAFDLAETDLYEDISHDYRTIRDTIAMTGFESLSGSIGKYIQPRTKGKGHGSTTRAFYARKNLVEYIIGMKESPRKLYPILDSSATGVVPALVAEAGETAYSPFERRLL